MSDFASAYARAIDDETATSFSQLLIAIAFRHLEEPERWTLHTIYAAKAFAVARDRAGEIPTSAPRWTEILDRMERARANGRPIPSKSRLFPRPMLPCELAPEPSKGVCKAVPRPLFLTRVK